MNKNNIAIWLEAEGDNPTNPVALPTNDENPQEQPPENPENTTQQDQAEDPSQIEQEPKQENDFEKWRNGFFDLIINSRNEEILNSIKSIRDREGLEVQQRKFIEDNYQIYSFRRDSNILQASEKIRSLIKNDLDQTNPAMTLMQHIITGLNEQPLIYQNLIKLAGTFGWKSDLHRKWLASLLGAIQVGGGGSQKDLVYSSKDYNINISTRFTTQFGEINLGKFNLIKDDSEKYLSNDEQKNLMEGSPEEKQVIRRKLILKSIGEAYRKRAFLINVVTSDGTVHALGWDLGNSLLDGYQSGQIVVRGLENENKEIMIADDGSIVPLIDYTIMYNKDSGEIDENGKPIKVEVPFITRKESILYLVCDLEIIKVASSSLSGIFYTAIPYGGNPAEILQIQRSVPGLFEILLKQVG